ncbi:MAG: hypothetical protein Q8874_02815, partial [Sweet potato little leaf phytoplasma]|nr:hypothetical protein [Sweet potato little leaf phytoplasma]
MTPGSEIGKRNRRKFTRPETTNLDVDEEEETERVKKGCTYKYFASCNPKPFSGPEGAIYLVYIIMVKEDVSLFSYKKRKEMVKLFTENIKN